MTKIIDGKKISQKLKDNLKIEIENIKNSFNRVPGLAVVQVGDVAASSVYVKAKTKAAKEVGIIVFDHHLDASTTQSDLLHLINELNQNKDVNGILVQLPLPKNINEQIILDSIHPNKDADGFHPLNVGKLSISKSDSILKVNTFIDNWAKKQLLLKQAKIILSDIDLLKGELDFLIMQHLFESIDLEVIKKDFEITGKKCLAA